MLKKAHIVHLWAAFVLAGLLAANSLYAAADTCGGCGDASFPDAADFLASRGYPADEYTVLMAWQEAARNDMKKLVSGYHVQPVHGGQPFDLYSDSSGGLLSPEDLAALGVLQKNWNLRPIEQETEIPPALAKSVPVRPVPVSVAQKVAAPVAVQLEAVDLASLLSEDAQAELSPNKGPRRVGVVRGLPQAVTVTGQDATAGTWTTLAGGTRLWSMTVISPAAHAIRVHFAEVNLPGNARAVIFNSANPVEAYGPYQRVYPGDDGLWAASCFSDSVTIECSVPAGTDVGSLELVIDEIAHTYADSDTLQWTKAAGTCNKDVSCYDEWTTAASGVAGWNYLANSMQLYCTGSLIEDTDPETYIPYFLTASHCLEMAGGAGVTASMEFFWLYQTSGCHGTIPPIADVPRTGGGAEFLNAVSASTGTDFALVRLRNAPPNGTAFVGWTTLPPGIGTNVVAIHHPSNDYKRISFGHLTNTGSPLNGGQPLQSYDSFHEVHWDQGTTEHGSSGCPLMIASGGNAQKIVGQLWGGNAACLYPNEPDYFGRFDKSYPLVQQYLSPPTDPLDINKSGSVNSADIQEVVNAALGRSIPSDYNADVDHSGRIDAVDVQLVIWAVLHDHG